ncbi:helix-turn-helix domain-containing protein [Devosia sp. LjRoot16]|uniref:helix-turn-helix domain-containing protein n=1 Tax=Devosia sp. LjRoot16 TaxID=3342271 RepID=UPI003F508C6D
MLNAYNLHPDRAATLQLVGLQAADVERELILATLRATHGNRTHAAAILAISIRTLRNKLHEYLEDGIDVPPPHDAGKSDEA